jgi:hypothetical protein
MSKRPANSGEYERTIFLNYPYDRTYFPVRNAILFAVTCCGFIARSAEEEYGTLDQRIDKIVHLIKISGHGIHDLSLLPTEDAPRMNMPFELGIFYGAKRLGNSIHKTKNGFAFDAEIHRHHKALSDSAGIDLQIHNFDPIAALVCVQRYLKRHTSRTLIGPAPLMAIYAEFFDALPTVCTDHGLVSSDISFEELRGVMAIWIGRRLGKND